MSPKFLNIALNSILLLIIIQGLSLWFWWYSFQELYNDSGFDLQSILLSVLIAVNWRIKFLKE